MPDLSTYSILMKFRSAATWSCMVTLLVAFLFPDGSQAQPQAQAPGQSDGRWGLVEPRLKLAPSLPSVRPRIALTFDACSGKADERILSTLISERIPSTVFVTARWLRSNPKTTALFRENADLFEIENHGENHIPAVARPAVIYGIASAGSSEAVNREVSRGVEAILAAGFAKPQWFRGSTARYDPTSIHQIRSMGYRVAGYSLNGDGGSLLGASATERRIANAAHGDVVIAHINQPSHAAGEGVARALKALKARGVEFVKLGDTESIGGDGDIAQSKP